MSNQNLLQNRLYYDGDYEIGPAEIERLVQALLFLSDHVMLHASCRPKAQLSAEHREWVIQQILGLVEEGLLLIWDYPKSDASSIKEETLGRLVNQTQIMRLSTDQYNSIYDNTSKKVSEYSTRLYQTVNRSDYGPAPLEYGKLDGLSELVHVRTNLWSVSLAAALGATGIIVNQARRDRIERDLVTYYRYSRVEEPLLQRFLDAQSITGLSTLNAKDIRDLQGMKSSFRKFLNQYTKQLDIHNSQTEMVSLSQELNNRFNRELQEIADIVNPNTLFQRLFKGTVVDILGNLLPIARFVPYAEHLYDWSLQKLKHGHVFYIIDVGKRKKQIKK